MNMCSLKVYGLTSINPNITALTYGKDMEQHASNAFFEILKCSLKEPRLSSYGLFLMVNNDSLVLVLIKV